MNREWHLEPWILATVLAERQKYLAANPHASSTATIEVNCTGEKPIQILDFGGQKTPPFTRLSISDSSTKVLASLSENARKEIQRRTERRPPSQTEGAVCELTHYSLKFEPGRGDGLSIHIHKLVYKGGACMPPIGEPKQIAEQEGAAQLRVRRAMGSSPSQKKPATTPEHEPHSSPIMSQTELLSNDGQESSDGGYIATQEPRRGGMSRRHHDTGNRATTQGNLVSVVKGFLGRREAEKRPLPGDDAPTSSGRAKKRQHIEHSQAVAPFEVPSTSTDDAQLECQQMTHHSPPTQKLAQKPSVVGDTATCLDGQPGSKSVDEVDKATISTIGALGDRSHNKAVSGQFYIGLKSLPRKFVAPPKSQLQHLSTACYVDPRAAPEEQHFTVPPNMAGELSDGLSALRSGATSTTDSTANEITQVDDGKAKVAEGLETSTPEVFFPEAQVSSPLGRPVAKSDGGAQEEDAADVSDAGSVVTWSSSSIGSPQHISPIVPSDEAASGRLRSHLQETHQGRQLEDEDKSRSSPLRSPLPTASSLLEVKSPSTFVKRPLSAGQIPSSSLPFESEMEQEVPTALHSSGEDVPMHSRSSPPIPEAFSLPSAPFAVLQIERSPFGRDLVRQGEKVSAVVTGTAAARLRAEAMSSDPIVPATCWDSQETGPFHLASQEEFPTIHSSASNAVTRQSCHKVLVPATIPGKHQVDHKNHSKDHTDTQIVPGTLAASGSASSRSSIGGSDICFGKDLGLERPAEDEPRAEQPFEIKPNTAPPALGRPRQLKAILVAPDFSQPGSSVDTAEMARANRRSFLAQPQGQDIQQARETTPSLTNDHEVSQSRIGATAVSPLRATVFERFKSEYPQFPHERSKFVMACAYIKWLQDNRKVMPVHSFLWDDFIRTFCGPYSDYLKSRKDEEAVRLSSVDFYNRKVTSPIFQKNVVTRATLLQALDEDPILAKKHTQRLRRISSNFMPRSEATTPQDQRMGDMEGSRPSPREEATASSSGRWEGDEPGQVEQSGVSVLRLDDPEHENVAQEVPSTTKPSSATPYGRSQRISVMDGSKSQRLSRRSSSLVTPRNSARPKYLTLVHPNGTPGQFSPALDDPVEQEVYSTWVPVRDRRRSDRASLPSA